MKFLQRHRFIIALLLIAGVSRFVILFLSQTHVHNDEAVIGLMGKHISEGRALPLYMYGQHYNAAAAWEAYLAVVPFKLFGVSVIPLKSVIVLLSLLCLFLFYKVTQTIYDGRTAIFAAIVFALVPSLLKWHFQVRGYSFYFLAIPILMIAFWRCTIQSKAREFFLFGLASGLSILALELSLPVNAALWLVLLCWRKMSIKHAAVAVAGFIAGYSPAIIYNFTHQFANWHDLFAHQAGSLGAISEMLVRPSKLWRIFIDDMPKFFGPDTVLDYYPEKSWIGFAVYLMAVTAVLVALWPFARRPSRLRASLHRDPDDTTKDLVVLFLAAACFIAYLVAPAAPPRYFLGSSFFLSVLIGRMMVRCFESRVVVRRAAGGAVLITILAAGIAAMFRVASQNEIETLTLCEGGNNYCPARIPGSDIKAVEHHLRDYGLRSVWTSSSLCYPLIFETRESIAISDAVFGWERNLYPAGVELRQPQPDDPPVFVLESTSPVRAEVEARLTESGDAPPLVTEYGTLCVIEQR